MKTIEERAHKEYGCVIAGRERTYNENLGNAYIKGAKDQQQIDIECACNALNGLIIDLNCDIPNIEKAKECLTKVMKGETTK